MRESKRKEWCNTPQELPNLHCRSKRIHILDWPHGVQQNTSMSKLHIDSNGYSNSRHYTVTILVSLSTPTIAPYGQRKI